LNKTELVSAVAEKTQLSKSKAEEVINNLLEIIASNLSTGEKIQLLGFGSFEVKSRSERTGRNPQTGETITIPAARIPSFTAGKLLKDIVNNKTFIEDFLSKGKINEVEANILTYVYENCNKNEFGQIEVKDIAENLKLDNESLDKMVADLIAKKLLNTMVYYGPTDSVYLPARWRKYL
jgi:nucleoid DNA-binding protein